MFLVKKKSKCAECSLGKMTEIWKIKDNLFRENQSNLVGRQWGGRHGCRSRWRLQRSKEREIKLPTMLGRCIWFYLDGNKFLGRSDYAEPKKKFKTGQNVQAGMGFYWTRSVEAIFTNFRQILTEIQNSAPFLARGPRRSASCGPAYVGELGWLME